MKYRYVEHTSDLGVEILGRDLPELFRNACYAVFDNILNLDAVVARDSRTITLKSATLEELFFDWLRELLFRFATEYFAVKDVTTLKLDGTSLQAEVTGEKFDPSRHRIKIEIKVPTYHLFRITREGEGYKAFVIFDV